MLTFALVEGQNVSTAVICHVCYTEPVYSTTLS